MRKQSTAQFVFTLLILLLLTAACRRDEDEPQPTAVPSAPTAITENTGTETTATAVPQPTTPAKPTEVAIAAEAVPVEDIDWPPQAIASDPAPGEAVLLDSDISLRFDQPMDQASVEAAWAIEPAIDGAFNWPRPDTVIFKPDSALKRDQTYKVSVAETAVSQNGLALLQTITFDLQTVGNLEVTEMIPEDGTRDVQADGAVTVVFNKPVVPLVSSGQQANLPQPLSFSPDVEGQGEWVSTSIYRFVPTDGFAGATTYQVTVDNELTDVTGGMLNTPVSWQFTTDSPAVVSVIPANGSKLVLPTQPISITFNMPMDRSSTETAVSLDPAASLSYTWHEEDRLLVATPQDSLNLETDYTLNIASSASSANGQASLRGPVDSTFTSIPFPAITETNPQNGAITEPWDYGVSIQFAAPMDFDTLNERISIDPAPAKIRYNYNEYIDPFNPDYSNFNLFLEFNLERNTDYVITVPGDAADPYGNTLGDDYTWRFSTPGNAPVASFNLPSNQSQLSTSFPTEVEILHRNISQLDVAMDNVGIDIGLINDSYRINDVSFEPTRTWNIPLDTPAETVGITPVLLADGDVLPTGVYVIRVTAPEINSESAYWQNRTNLLIVADTNLVVKEMPDEVRVWATDLASGAPVSGRNLVLYDRTGEELGTAVSDNNGFARFDYTPTENYLSGATVVSNAPGEAGFGIGTSFWSGNVSPWQMGINYGYSIPNPTFTYLYTDRPIYRPGDTLYFKGIMRAADYGRYALPEPQTVELRIGTNFYAESGGLDESMEVEVNADGIFYGEYVIPEDVTLGSYALFIPDGSDTRRTFTIAEYRKPEFQVLMAADKDEALRGETVDVTLDAEYFFGGTPAGLAVNYSIYEQQFSPTVDGPWYAFSDQANLNYVDYGPFGFFGGGGGTFGSYVNGGSGVTDENGRLIINLPADLLDEVEEGSRTVTVEATVNDISNFPVTSHTSVIFHAADLYVGVRPAEYGPFAGSETAVDLITVDWDGEPVGNQEVEVVIYQREWVSSRETDFGIYYTAWEPIDTEVARETTRTDELGQGIVSFVPEEGGTYIAEATVTDSSGRSHTSTTTVWVTDDTFVPWRTDPTVRTMELVPENQDLRAGDTARILVQSPFEGAVNAWLTIERGNLIEQRVITIDGSSTVLEIPMTPAFAPNVFVSVIAIKPTEPDSAEPYADIRLGITELQVEPEQFDLDLELTPRAEFFEPGETAVYDIRTTRQGVPVSADFSLALVDLAVLTLQADNAPHILEAFYAAQPYMSQVGSGLFISGEGLEPEIPLEGGGGGGGGGGDMAAEAVAKLEEDEDVRRDFPDTAYWEASVQTDADGTAVVEIPLPDSLTTWRLSSKAVTIDTEVGQNSTDVTVSLPLLVRPVTPRFFTVGDVVQIGAIANNNTNSDIEATLSLSADGLSGDLEPQTVTVPANGQTLVRWEVGVEDVPFADLTFRVEGGGYKDATKPAFGVGPDQLIPVYRYSAQDIVGTAGELDVGQRRVEAVLLPPHVDTSRGSVDLQLSPSMAAAIIDALEVVGQIDIQPLCAHALTDRLLPNIATAQAINTLELDAASLTAELDSLIPADISQLQSLQKENGGWGWCFSPESDPWLSAYSVLALAKAQDAGFAVDNAVLEKGIAYVDRQLAQMNRITDTEKANRQAFFLYVLAESGASVTAGADELVDEHRDLLDSYAKALLLMAYDLDNASGPNQQTLLSDLSSEGIISATGVHWEDMQQDFFNLSSTIRATAMVVDALARVQPDSSLLPHAVRWLMVARTAQTWPTHHETAWSLYALTDWLAVSGELDASYDYQVAVNATPLTQGTFTPETVTESESIAVPVRNLLLDETNFFDFQRGEGDGRFYYSLQLNSAIAADTVEPISRGLTVTRTYYDAACDPETETCEPIDSIEAGQRVRVELTVVAANDLLYAIVEDPLPAGAQGIDPGLATTSADLGGSTQRVDEEFKYGYWGWWYFNHIEYRDEKVVFLADYLPAGTYQYTYYLDTNIPGEYQVMPAFGYQEFFPEVNGRSAGKLFIIEE